MTTSPGWQQTSQSRLYCSNRWSKWQLELWNVCKSSAPSCSSHQANFPPSNQRFQTTEHIWIGT